MFLGLFIIGFVAGSIWLVYYFINKSSTPTVIYKTEMPFKANITKKTVATGAIVPKREVPVKPQVSGIIEALYVEAGQQVSAGQLIAKVRVVQNLSGKNNDLRTINEGERAVQTAKVSFENAQIEKERQEKLLAQKAISQQEYQRALTEFNMRKEELARAEKGLDISLQNVMQNSGRISNDIYSTVDGMVLDVPVKVGSSVIERNNFNEGTTIAIVADMNSLIFEGKVDESEVGKIKEGMDLNLTIGAIVDKTFKAKLEFISPKGVTEEGSIKFQIKAKVLLNQGDFIRAGYSANADIVLDQKDSVLSIKESMLQFGKKDSVFVEVETSSAQVFEKRLIKTGISDGINIEVISGIDKNSKIKLPEMKTANKEDKK
ncbi:MAG: efflux RND transporter periplasmic adaptor subunit [Cytophagales bacterium]|nr:MAG: efflux RND transporter periplasmic adaptor subunit [Cytophagales bacterium]